MIFSFHVNFRGAISRFPDFCTSMVARPRKSAVLGAAHVATRARSPRKARGVRRSRRCLRDLLGSVTGRFFTGEEWESNFRGANKNRQNEIFWGNFQFKYVQFYKTNSGWDSRFWNVWLELSNFEHRWHTSYILVYILTPGCCERHYQLSASKLGDENYLSKWERVREIDSLD